MTAAKRTYNVLNRQTKAKETKSAILAAANELFASNGFEKTTIEAIAGKVGVSVPTVYSLFRSKSGLLKALADVALAPGEYEAIVRRIEGEASLAKRLALTATLSRQLYDAERKQLGSLGNASIVNSDLKKMEAEREERRYKRQAESFKRFKNKSLLGNLNEQKTRDVLWALTGRDLYRMLVIERGWTSDAYEEWLAHLLTGLISGPDHVETM